MYSSDNKRLFDLILDKLNENSQGVTFDGNYMFKFNQPQFGDNFEIISKSSTTLAFEKTEVVPLVDVQAIEMPYVQLNKQADWEREFYVAIKLPRSTDDETSKMIIEFSESLSEYQAVLETIDAFRDELTFIDGDYKYSFKVKEPTKVNVFKYNKEYYQILSLTFNLTSIQSGFFGNETKLYFGLKSDGSFTESSDYIIDFRQFTEIVGKTSRASSNVNTTEESYSVDKRTYEAKVVANFNGNTADLLLYKEKSTSADIDTLYQIKITNSNLNTFASENLDYTFDVTVKDITITYENNIVDTIEFTLQRS